MNALFRNIYSATAGLLLLTAALPLRAVIIGADTLNADGSYTYSYKVDNTSGAFDISYWSLEFDFATPDWDQTDIFAGGGVTVPDAGWFAMAGIPLTGQSDQDFLSLSASGDVVGGASLGGFSFTSWFAPALVTFEEFDAFGSASTQGLTVGPSSGAAAAVPEGSGPYALMGAAFLAVSSFLVRKGALSPGC
jgi:hypothetical protein